MGTNFERTSSLSVIIYSSFLILICEILFFRVSYQFFSIFAPLPFLFIGLLIPLNNFSISIFISLIVNFLLNLVFPEKLVAPEFIIFNFLISLLSILFFYLLNQINKKRISESQFVSIINIFFLSILIIFYLVFFGGSEQSQIKEFLHKLITKIFESYKINQNQNVDNVIDTLVTILPAMNILLFMITSSFNFAIAKFVVRKLNFNIENKIDLSQFYTPVWFSFLYLLFLFVSLFFNESSILQKLSVNSLICLSFSYLLEGYILSGTILRKIKTHLIIKFLIIFLLFLFLGYVLLLIIIMLGIYRNLKKISGRNS